MADDRPIQNDAAAPPPQAVPTTTAAAAEPGGDGGGAQAAWGAKWSFIGVGGRQGLRLLLGVVLARLLGPENFGLVGQAMIVVGFLSLFVEGGLASAIVQRKHLTDADVGTAIALNLAVGGALALATAASAPLIASFFGSPELVGIVRILSLTFLVQAITIVPLALLNRAFRFRALAIAEVGTALVGGAAGLAVAIAGGEYWALVVQSLVTDVLFVIVVLIVLPRPALALSRDAVRTLWSFGSRVLGYYILNHAVRNADNLLVAKVFGASPLALYSLSYRTMLVPIEVLGTVVNRVAFPTYSRNQDDPERIVRQFLRGAQLISLIAFPLLALVIVLAPVGIPWVFGTAWAGAVVPMQILAVGGMRQAVMYTVGPVLMARGRADWQFRWGLVTAAGIIPGYSVGLLWGIEGVAAGGTAAGFFTAYYGLHKVRGVVDLRLTELAAAITPALVATMALLATGVVATEAVDRSVGSAPVVLAAGGAAGILAYLSVLRVRWPSAVRDTLAILRMMGGRS